MAFQPSRPPKSPAQFYHNRHTYVPPRVERAMARKLEQSVPAGMKKFVGPYMEQNVISTGMAGNAAALHSPSFTPHPVNPYQLNQNHFQPNEESPQPSGTVNPGPSSSPGAPSFAPQQPATQQSSPVEPAQSPTPNSEYDFIVNPEIPKKTSPAVSLPLLSGVGPTLSRIIIAAGGLILLLIVFSLLKGLLTSPPANMALLTSVAQDQQEIVHLASSVTQQQQTPVSTTNKNFATTAQLSVLSSQASLIHYMALNGKKVNLKILSLKINPALDSRLTTAAAATTYDQTFQEIMNNQLTNYIGDLQQAYQQTKGKNGRALLNDCYNQAQLLSTQLNASSPGDQ